VLAEVPEQGRQGIVGKYSRERTGGGEGKDCGWLGGLVEGTTE
jgi:hypothetical protein